MHAMDACQAHGGNERRRRQLRDLMSGESAGDPFRTLTQGSPAERFDMLDEGLDHTWVARSHD
jgi:hypothetical protein